MKPYCHKSLGILIIRLLIGGLFLYAGIMKIPMATEMAPFVGWAAHALGLTFLSLTAWFWIVVVAEILAGALFVAGLFTRFASFLVIIIMLVAMNAMGRGWMQIQIPFMMLVIAVALFTSGPGRYSLSAWGNCTRWVCGMGGSCAMPTTKAKPVAVTAAKPAKKIVFKKKK
jgi:uncharacterized membrane protein YphA (DoxX/SURF4 family)